MMKSQSSSTRRSWAVAASFLLVGIGGAAHAGGIFVPGAGGPLAQGRAGAFVAKADDPSAIAHNPAGFAKGKGTVVLIGANFLSYDLSFQRSGGYETPTVGNVGDPYPKVKDGSKPAIGFGSFQAIPIIAVTTDFGLNLSGLRFGIGLFAPNGFPERRLDADYSFEDPTRNAPPTRYDMVSQDVAAAFPSFGVAYSYSGAIEVDVGARFSWGVASIKAESYLWGFRNYEEDIGVDGQVIIDAKDNFIPSAGVGALVRPIPSLEFGFAYNSPSNIAAKGSAVSALGSRSDDLGIGVAIEPQTDPAMLLCENKVGGTVASLNTCVDLTLPQSASLGGRYIFRDNKGAEKADIELDIKWEDWSAGSDIEVRIDALTAPVGLPLKRSVVRHGFQDTYSVRLGGSYSFPVGNGKLLLSAGGAYDTAAAPLRWQRADIDGAAKITMTGGVAYEFSRFRVGLAGGAVLQPDRTVPECNPDVGDPNPACVQGSGPVPVPTPAQPLIDANSQVLSPFNSGKYSSGYTILSLGVTTWF